jgi:signal transduction histidine kinase
MASPGDLLFGLRTKLIIAFSLVALAALAIAGSIFVAVRRGDERKEALNRVITSSPIIYANYSYRESRGATSDDLRNLARAASEQFNIRVLLVERATGIVSYDSSNGLTGEKLDSPPQAEIARIGPRRGYVSWEPASGSPGNGLILVSTEAGNISGGPTIDDPYALLLAVPKESITGAWRGLLPQAGIAAAIALPIAVLLGILVAAYITGPLRQLTLASQSMAEGVYDVRVSVDRRDEVGRLAQTFSSMSRRVGETHSQMRALVANVSHDLKTPLTSILGFAQALRDGGAKGDEETRRMGSVIYEEATRLNTRLNDLLYLAELESGQLVLQRDEIDVSRLVGGAVDRAKPASEARGVELAANLTPGLAVSGDGPRIERVVENLIDNARKYTPTGGEIRVRDYAVDGRVNVDVVNSAPDITPDELPRLFERFYRRDRTRGNEHARAGTGLGLAIARELIELHGGTLTASLRDEEIAFTISLPATAEPQPPESA